jgi:hypothetical protein
VSFFGAKKQQIKFTFARPPQPRPPAASATPQRAAPNNVCRANGGSGVGAPHPKATLTKDPGSRATWVRPTSPPSAPSGQRAADLTIEGRSGASTSCGAPSVIVGDESGARPQAAGCSLPGPGDNAAVFPRPGQTGPLPPKKDNPVYTLSRFNFLV